ncbi:hypothetical protein ABFT23_21305 [Nocardioides sp. C4-1]|uniref:phage tail protein n=1 Tax=Nocardioides sp. C4-1 TaxID=3151851 RepID=UPI003267D4AB
MSAAREHAASEALARGREAVTRAARPRGPAALVALQRSAGNGAVAALMAGRTKASGDAAAEIDRALTEVRGGDPDIDAVEKGLKATRAAGVPVDIDGEAQKPGPNALAVTKTGFGPGSVTPKKPVPPTKPVKPVSPLGKAAAKAPRPAVPSKDAAPRPASTPTAASGGGAGAALAGPAPLAPGAELAPPVAPAGTRPADDPAFQQVEGGVADVAGTAKAHPTAASKAQEAQGAAQAPADDLAAQARAAKADTMDAQQAGTFDKPAFIAAVKTAIEAKAPQTLEEAESAPGRAGEVKGEVKGMLGADSKGAAKDIEAATDAPPDQSTAVPKDVEPMAAENPGRAGVVPAAGAAPKPAPADQTNLAAGKHQTDAEMADAGVTEQQLARSNEPEFEGALTARKKAAEHADTAPAAYREQEKAKLEQSKADAGAETRAGLTGMHGAKGAAIAQLVAQKGQAKSKDEAKRAEVTARVQSIFTATEADVKKILNGIDAKVDAAFETGEASAKAAFEAFVAAKMSAYKRERYGGWLGGLKWAKDKLLGMPSAVDAFYEAGRELYLQRMDGVISRVADIVGGDLGAAKQRIARGRSEISAYVTSLPQDLRKVGTEAATEMGDRFEQLESDVGAKQDALVESLATKYVEARKGLDERIAAMQAENKGLVDAAIGAIKGVIDTIKGLVDMLKNVLARAASAIEDIIKDPVGFLGNLVAGVKGGIMRFFANIGTHLKKGLMGWLFGQLADAGIEMPETFDLKGIIKLVASVFGLSWANIRSRIVKQIGEKAMGAIEKGVDIFAKIASGGIGAVWELIVEKLGDIKAMIMEQVEDFVVTKVITAGITWLIGLLNPAAAFIKACKLIYDVIMFFVTNGSRIMKLVTTIIDGVVDIAKGNVSSVMAKIEDVLGQMVPVLIGFLASVLGVGGIGEKIKSIIQTLQKPFTKAIDVVIKAGLKLAGPVIRGVTGLGAKAKKKVAAGKAYVKGKVDAGKTWTKDKIAGLRERAGFSARGTSHSVTVTGDKPENVKITVASTPREAGAAMTRAMAAADIDTLPDARDRVAAAAAFRDVDAKRGALQELARQVMMRSGGSIPPELLRQARALANAIARCWEIIGYDGESINRVNRGGEAGQAGDVHRHGQKGKEFDDAKTGREREVSRLESEHVVPWGWCQAIVQKLFGIGTLPGQSTKKTGGVVTEQGSVAYPRLTTVMIYERAAELKTSQLSSNDAQFKRWIEGVSAADARRTLAEHLPTLVKSRMDIITTAVGTYVAKVQREDGISLPHRPDEPTIRRATAAQLAEIFAAIRESRR